MNLNIQALLDNLSTLFTNDVLCYTELSSRIESLKDYIILDSEINSQAIPYYKAEIKYLQLLQSQALKNIKSSDIIRFNFLKSFLDKNNIQLNGKKVMYTICSTQEDCPNKFCIDVSEVNAESLYEFETLCNKFDMEITKLNKVIRVEFGFLSNLEHLWIKNNKG